MNILVTAGPTREYLDPVRFLSNRSSGKMGYAIADEAQARGHRVHLVSGPVSIAPSAAVRCSQVVSAQEMRGAVMEHFQWADVLVMCAAVADWRPSACAEQKLKKGSAQEGTLRLVRTADILMEVRRVRRPNQLIVGFAAETHDMLTHARDKLERKGLDLLVANDVSRTDAGFGVDTNAVTLLEKGGGQWELPLQSKQHVARAILDWIEGQSLVRSSGA